jgi:putative membrane protein
MPEDPSRDPRVFLAAERTLLAWIRTGLAMMGFGFLVTRLDLFDGSEPGSHSLWGGVTLVAIGVLLNVVAAVAHARFISRFNRGLELRARPVSAAVIVAVLLSLIGVGLIAYLLSGA